MSLYSEMTLKIFNTHYPQMQTGLNKGCSTEAGSWRPLYLGPSEEGVTAGWGEVKEVLEEGSGQKG